MSIRYYQFLTSSDDIDWKSYWIGGKYDNFDEEWRWDDGTKIKMGAPYWARVSSRVGSKPHVYML